VDDTTAPWTALYEFRIDRNVFRLRVVDGRLVELARGEADRPDTVVVGPQAAVQAVFERKPMDDALSVTGDREALDRLVAATRPDQAPLQDTSADGSR
jgi:hypothetical protein